MTTTVWAVYAQNGAFVAATPNEDSIAHYERQGYTVAPMALVSPEALEQLVRAAWEEGSLASDQCPPPANDGTPDVSPDSDLYREDPEKWDEHNREMTEWRREWRQAQDEAWPRSAAFAAVAAYRAATTKGESL